MKVKLIVNAVTEVEASTEQEAIDNYRIFLCENPTFLWDSIKGQKIYKSKILGFLNRILDLFSKMW